MVAVQRMKENCFIRTLQLKAVLCFRKTVKLMSSRSSRKSAAKMQRAAEGAVISGPSLEIELTSAR